VVVDRRPIAGAAGDPAAGGDPPGAVQVWVTDRPGSDAAVAAVAAGAQLVAVALPALATGFGAGLPDGALDAAVEVRGQGDVFVPPVRPAGTDPALVLPGQPPVTHDELIAAAEEAADRLGLPPGVRLLTGAGPAHCLEGLLAPLVRDGSIVLRHDLVDLDPDQHTRLAAQERITDLPGWR